MDSTASQGSVPHAFKQFVLFVVALILNINTHAVAFKNRLPPQLVTFKGHFSSAHIVSLEAYTAGRKLYLFHFVKCF